MKKRSRNVKKSSSRKSSSRKNVQHALMLPFSFRRIVIITTCIALFIMAFTSIGGQGRQGVAGIKITDGLFAQATVAMPQVEGAVAYNVYYKETGENVYKNAVRSIPTTVTEYRISYLSKDVDYTYKISVVDASGAETWWSAEKPLDNIEPM